MVRLVGSYCINKVTEVRNLNHNLRFIIIIIVIVFVVVYTIIVVLKDSGRHV
jgi:uncharacterized protein HemY